MKRTTKKAMPKVVEVDYTGKGLAGLMQFADPTHKYYRFGGCTVQLSNHDNRGWHISIGCKNRYPTWDEITHARYSLIPDDVVMVMVLPAPEDYVNLNENTFHLHEIPKEVYKEISERRWVKTV